MLINMDVPHSEVHEVHEVQWGTKWGTKIFQRLGKGIHGRNRIQIFDRKKWKFVDISDKEFDKIRYGLVLQKYQNNIAKR